MLIHVDLLVVFLIVCIVQGATAVGMLLTRWRRRPAARWLTLWLLAVTLQVIDYTLSRSGTYYRHQELYFLPLSYTLALGPLLFGAFRSARTTNASMRPVHFLPVVVQAGFYVIMCFQPVDTKAQVWMSLHKPVTRWLEYYGALVSLGLYLAAAWRLVGGDAAGAQRLAGLVKISGLEQRQEFAFVGEQQVDLALDEAQQAQLANGVIKVLSGPAAGREMALVKPVTSLGKTGVSVATITRNARGFVLAYVEGDSPPMVNGAAIGNEPVALKNGYRIELAGTQMQFVQG